MMHLVRSLDSLIQVRIYDRVSDKVIREFVTVHLLLPLESLTEIRVGMLVFSWYYVTINGINRRHPINVWCLGLLHFFYHIKCLSIQTMFGLLKPYIRPIAMFGAATCHILPSQKAIHHFVKSSNMPSQAFIHVLYLQTTDKNRSCILLRFTFAVGTLPQPSTKTPANQTIYYAC